jgi:PAS domain-containing protein
LIKKLINYFGCFIYGDIEIKLQKIIDEIEKDKTKTERLEEELIRSRQEIESYKNLVITIGNTIPDMMWAKDLNGKYLYVNYAILDGLFYSESYQNIIGKCDVEISKRCKEKVGSENHTFGEICKNSDKIVLENLKKERFLEWGLINGKDLYLEVYKAPLIDRDGRVVGTIGTGRDITEWYLELKDAILSSSNCSTMCKNNVTSDILQQLDKYKFEG